MTITISGCGTWGARSDRIPNPGLRHIPGRRYHDPPCLYRPQCGLAAACPVLVVDVYRMEFQRVLELRRERAARAVALCGRREEDAPAVAGFVFVDRHGLEGVELRVQHVLERAGAGAGREPQIQGRVASQRCL